MLLLLLLLLLLWRTGHAAHHAGVAWDGAHVGVGHVGAHWQTTHGHLWDRPLQGWLMQGGPAQATRHAPSGTCHGAHATNMAATRSRATSHMSQATHSQTLHPLRQNVVLLRAPCQLVALRLLVQYLYLILMQAACPNTHSTISPTVATTHMRKHMRAQAHATHVRAAVLGLQTTCLAR